MKILVTDVSSYKAVSFVKALKNEADIDIVTIDYRDYTKYFRTKYSKKHFIVAPPKINPDKYLQDILTLSNQQAIDQIIPVNSEEIRLLLENRHLFGNKLDCFGDYNTFIELDDKKRLEELVSVINIKVPQKYSFDSEVNTINFPIVYKPTLSSSSKGVFYIYNAQEFEKHKANFKNTEYVLQQYVKGKGVGYSVLCNRGEILIGNGHIRLAEFPISGGSSTIRGQFFHEDMKKIAEKICTHTKWTGLAMFEFKLTDTNDIYLIEINPRVWGSINQSIQSGVNFPYYLLFPNKIPATPSVNTTTVTHLSPLSYISILLYSLKFNFSPAINLLKNIVKLKADVSLLNDIKGYISLLLRMF